MNSRADALVELIGSLRLAADAHHEVARDATGHLLTNAADELDRLRDVLVRIKDLPDTPEDCLATATNLAWDALH